ncbi:MAG: pyruvate kinase alpha/beta domain-containing protein, partial [Gemmatimonadota bacterium]
SNTPSSTPTAIVSWLTSTANIISLSAKPRVTGQTAVAVSSARQEIPIVAVTGHKKVQRQLSLVWGVYPIVSANIVSVNSVTKDIKAFLKKEYRLQAGDKVVFVDGVKKDKTEGEKLVGISTI